MYARSSTPALPMNADRRPIDCGRSFSRRASGSASPSLPDHRDRQERQQALADADRARARTAAAVRRRERLVQVHVDDVEAHVARAHLAEDRVEVGAVVVQQPARLVHDASRLPRCAARTRRAWTDW